MKSFNIACNLLRIPGIFLSMMVSVHTPSEGNESAEKLFREGKFEESKQQFTKIIQSDSKNFDALLGLGNIALLSNRFDEAEGFLNAALNVRRDDRLVMELLAELYYRQDKFEKAAPFFRRIGSEAVAKKLESFKGLVPYQFESKAEVTRIKFVHTDPLPLIQIKVNDHQANFILDTGGSEIFIDPEFAKKVNALDFGSTVATYGGGKKAATGHGRIEKITLGDFTIKNIPVHILDTRKFDAAANGLEVSGVIGTVLLYHFISTIDYPSGELVLVRKSPAALKQFEQQADKITIPFWMSGDHFMVAWGKVNNSKPLLFFVDTGLAGGGFVPAKSTVKEGGIQLLESQGFEGIGGGGAMTVVPFEVSKISLGDAEESNITGFFGPFPQQLEFSEGFRIAGIISHQFFRSYELTFDFEGMRLFLVKKPASKLP